MGVAAQTVSGKPSSSKALESFCRDLCQQARDKSIDVVSGTQLPAHPARRYQGTQLRCYRGKGGASMASCQHLQSPCASINADPLCGR